LVYPEAGIGDVSDSGSKILKLLFPQNTEDGKTLRGNFLFRDYYGTDPTIMRQLSQDAEGDDDVKRAASKFIFPQSVAEVNSVPPLPQKMPGDLRARVVYQIMKGKLPPGVDNVLKDASTQSTSKLLGSVEDACNLSSCSLSKVNSAVTAGIVSATVPEERKQSFERILCTECAVNDTTDWYKFKTPPRETLTICS